MEQPKFDPERARLNKLKADWLEDPCWDIEDTEGFEEYRDELRTFHEAKKAEWEAARVSRLQKKAEDIGAPGNLKLAEYVEQLEGRIKKLEGDVWRLYNPF